MLSIATELIHQVENPHGFVYRGDCRKIMREMLDGNIKYRLIFADPPFGVGVEYEGDFSDRMSNVDYRDFTFSWVKRTVDLLADGGRLYVHVPSQRVFDVLLAADACCLSQTEWINWHFRFGQCGRSKYINSKCHGLVFTNNPKAMTWNPDAVLVQSDRSSTYGDARTADSETPGLRVPLDIWGVPSDGPYWGRVQGNSAERRALHQNQLPEVYLARIIRGWTNPDDWVMDPFGGSGTTAVVARALGRNCVTIEQSAAYAESIVNRMAKGAIRV